MIQQFIAKLSPSGKKLFYVASLVVLLAVLDGLFFGPVTTQLKSLEEKIHQEEGSIKKDLRFLTYKNRILEEQDAFSPYFIRRVSTEEEIIANFLKKIEILATEANINLVKVTPLEGKQKKGFKEYTANLDCLGQLPNVVTFLHLVDSADDLIKTIKLTINAKKSETDEVTASITIAKILVDPIASMNGSNVQPKSTKANDYGFGEEIVVPLNKPNKKEQLKDPSPKLKDVTFSQE